jgi:hypothetical protein
MAVPWLWSLVAGPSQRRTGFDPKWVGVRYVMDIGIGTSVVRLILFSPLSPDIPPVFHTILIHMLLLPGGQMDDVCEPLKMV